MATRSGSPVGFNSGDDFMTARSRGDSTGKEMVLAAQEILVVVQFHRQAHLVAGRTKVRRAMERFEERRFVEGGLGLDHLVVDPLQEWVFTLGKRVVLRFFDGVGAVPVGAVDVRDGMAGGAGDAGLRG